MNVKNSYNKIIFYLMLIYMLLSPALPQLFNIKTPLIREWIMFSWVGHGSCHVNVYDKITGQWLDFNHFEGFVPSFKNEEMAREVIEEILKKNDNVKIEMKISTKMGWKNVNFE